MSHRGRSNLNMLPIFRLRSICFILVILHANAAAQKNTLIGIEAGATHDIYDYVDEHKLLAKGLLLGGQYGITVTHYLEENIFMEIGLFRKHYNEGLGFRNSPGYTTTNAFDAWLVAGRLGSRINLSKRKFFLVPVMGICRGQSDIGDSEAHLSGYSITPTDTFTHSVESKFFLLNKYSLLQTGLGAEAIVRRKVLLSLSANYYTGFRNVIEQDIQYTHNGSSYTGKGLSKGEFFSFSLGIKYPITRILKKRESDL